MFGEVDGVVGNLGQRHRVNKLCIFSSWLNSVGWVSDTDPPILSDVAVPKVIGGAFSDEFGRIEKGSGDFDFGLRVVLLDDGGGECM